MPKTLGIDWNCTYHGRHLSFQLDRAFDHDSGGMRLEACYSALISIPKLNRQPVLNFSSFSTLLYIMNTSLIKTRTKFRLFSTDLPLLYLANRDRRTPTSTRLITGLAIVYLFSPVDIVPDVLPLLGWVDDLFVTPFLISLALRTVPLDVLMDAQTRIKRTKGLLLAFVLISVAALAIYLGYQYFGPTLTSTGNY